MQGLLRSLKVYAVQVRIEIERKGKRPEFFAELNVPACPLELYLVGVGTSGSFQEYEGFEHLDSAWPESGLPREDTRHPDVCGRVKRDFFDKKRTMHFTDSLLHPTHFWEEQAKEAKKTYFAHMASQGIKLKTAPLLLSSILALCRTIRLADGKSRARIIVWLERRN